MEPMDKSIPAVSRTRSPMAMMLTTRTDQDIFKVLPCQEPVGQAAKDQDNQNEQAPR